VEALSHYDVGWTDSWTYYCTIFFHVSVIVKSYLVMMLIPQLDNTGLLNSVIFTQYGAPAHYSVCMCVFLNSNHYELDKLDLSAGSSNHISKYMKIYTSLNTTVPIRQYGPSVQLSSYMLWPKLGHLRALKI